MVNEGIFLPFFIAFIPIVNLPTSAWLFNSLFLGLYSIFKITQLDCVTIYRNLVAFSYLLIPLMKHKPPLSYPSKLSQGRKVPLNLLQEYLALSVLAWPAYLRLLVVLPAIVFLWLALAWANEGQAWW